jgi:osmoprotectant transport system permease protein
MGIFGRALDYAIHDGDRFRAALATHLQLVAIALLIGIATCVPLGILTSRSRLAALTLINGVNTMRVVPSLAILFLALPYFGLGRTSALIALTVLALPPILINTDAAFRRIDPAIREAALGMGMSPGQSLLRVEFPLALPVMLAGIRIALTEVIASATLAAFIGAGGLGIYITLGFAQFDNRILLVGAVPVALLALIAELGLSALQRAVQPPR